MILLSLKLIMLSYNGIFFGLFVFLEALIGAAPQPLREDVGHYNSEDDNKRGEVRVTW